MITSILIFVGLIAVPHFMLAILLFQKDHMVLGCIAVYLACVRFGAKDEVTETIVEKIVPVEKIKYVNKVIYRPAKMSKEEAYEVLGVVKGAGREVVHARWRALMARVHPDQGGTNYLAVRVNQAKDLLLGKRQ